MGGNNGPEKRATRVSAKGGKSLTAPKPKRTGRTDGDGHSAESRPKPPAEPPRAPGPEPSRPLRILHVDSQAVVFAGLRTIIDAHFPGAVLRHADTPAKALGANGDEEWDVIVLDVALPGRGGLDLIKELRSHYPSARVLVFSMQDEMNFGVRALKLGAVGYVPKSASPEVLVGAIRAAMAGHRHISQALASQLAKYISHESDRPAHEQLSEREFQVLCLLAQGHSVKEIGYQLCLSVKTISTYRTRILQKMELRNNSDIIRYCMRERLVDRVE